MSSTSTVNISTQWSPEQAWEWSRRQPWTVGCNFLPSTAINQLEMWQAESWDPETIDRELGWAALVGMNSVRTYLHDLAYEADRDGFLGRMEEFLVIATRHGIRPLFVFFDDCWNPTAALGPQPAPQPGVHNSGWVRSPTDDARNWPQDLPRLETYVNDVLTVFKDDARIYMWDLYNEPGNSNYESGSLELLKAIYGWAWKVRPSQPITAGMWFGNEELNAFQVANADVETFHEYRGVPDLVEQIEKWSAFGRPLVCTEWMARTNNSLIGTHLPVFKERGISCFQWGLVSGKSNTIFPWGSPLGTPEPKLWFHDLFRADGTPFDASEVEVYRQQTGV